MEKSSIAPVRTFPELWKYNDYQVEGAVARLILRDRRGAAIAGATIDYVELDRVLRAAYWKLQRSATVGLHYAVGTARGEDAPRGRKPRLYLHRLVMDAPEGLQVDHENGDGLDCRRVNMKLTTNKGNANNRRFQRRGLQLEHAIRQLLACPHGAPDCPCRVYARGLLPG